MEDVEEMDNVGVFYFFEEGDFVDGCIRYVFIFGFEVDFFEGDDVVVVE